ncbi:MAG TPA: tetratricopeptide repeat protein, partial [Candidatus Tumulicola sp.]|nr:tetratricopeptide repeat protein [Candidatus Tumulicola sp.]
MRAAGVTALIFFAAAMPALPQTYPLHTPAPATTSVPELKNLATAREIEERFRIGLDDEARGRWKEAAGEFERIVALGPAEPKGSTARYDLAIAYANLGRNDDAARQLQAAISLDPGFLAAMANLIAVELARGDLR